jgi:tetratricopeptide (TPR) repeat protein
MRGFAVFCLAIFATSSVALADSKKDWDDCASNDPERSLAGCNKIIARGKDTKANLAIAHYNRGNDYQADGDHDKAIADYNKSIDLKPQASAYHNRGYSYSRKDLYDKAIADYDKALKLEPKHKFAYYNRGAAYGEKGDHVQAVMDYNRAAKLTPDDHGLFNDRGHSYAQLGDLDKALADFEKSISLKSDYALAHSNRAWVLERKEKHQEAVAAYSEALRHGQANADDLNSRAFSEIKIGQYNAAIADLNEALRLNPKHPFAHQNRGWAYWLNGDLDNAIADYDEALRKSPDDIDLLVDHAGVLDDRGDYARAIIDYDKVLAIKSDHAVALNGRAWAYAQTGNLDKALVDSERAVALNPTEPNTLRTRAWIYAKKGMLDLAMSDYDKVLSIDPELAGAYADRGHIFELKGDRQKAIADYRKALSLRSKQVYDDKAKAEALTRLTKLAAVTPGGNEVALQPKPQPKAQAKKPEKRIALIIGNGDYVNVRALKNAGRDARAVAGAFRRLGFEVLEKHDLTFTELVSELKDFGDKAPSYDWAVVYYAGHGIEIGGINYLIPVDATLAYATHVDDEALPLDRVLAKVEGAKKLKLVILDACRENPFIAKMASAGSTRSVGRGLARIEPTGGVLVAYSAKDGQVAQDGDGNNSPYAEALLGLLDQPGLEISMLFRRVRDEVKSNTGGQQEPFTYGSLPAESFFFKSAAN